MLFYRDFIADYKLKIILLIQNVHYKNIIKNAIDLYNVNSFAYEFKTFKVEIVDEINDTKLDYLLTEYRKRKKDLNKKQKISLLAEIGAIYADQENITYGLKYLNEALILSQKIKHNRTIFDMKLALGRLYRYVNKYNLAEKYLLECIEFYKHEKILVNYKASLEFLSLLYSDKLDYKNALKYCNELYELTIETNDKEMELASLNVFSLVYTKMNDEKNSEIYFNRALELAEYLNDDFILADLYQDRAIKLINSKKYREALNYLQKTLLLYQKENKLTMIQKLYCIYAYIYFQMNDFKRSLIYAEHSYSFFQKNNLKEDVFQVVQLIGHNYMSLNVGKKAIVYMEKALEIAKTLQKGNYYFDSLISLIDINIEIGNYIQVEFYMKETNKIIKKLDTSDLLLLYRSYASYYRVLNNIKKAYEYYNKARNIIEDSLLLDELYGEILLKDNKPNEALGFFQKALTQARKDDDLNEIISIELNLAKTYKELNNKLLANRFYNEVLNKLSVINKEDKRIIEIKKDLESL